MTCTKCGALSSDINSAGHCAMCDTTPIIRYAVQQHMDNLSTADVYIPVEKRAWAALQVQAKFYNDVSTLLADPSMSDISILACIYAKREDTETELQKIRGID